jgi:hypothetical protein
MSNKIIYPALIIIFSILIVYAILTKRKNDKLNNNIENFLSDTPTYTPVDISNDDLTNNNLNNNIITQKFENGYWTTPWTQYTPTNGLINLMNVKINSLMNPNNISSQNYGNINLLNVLTGVCAIASACDFI